MKKMKAHVDTAEAVIKAALKMFNARPRFDENGGHEIPNDWWDALVEFGKASIQYDKTREELDERA